MKRASMFVLFMMVSAMAAGPGAGVEITQYSVEFEELLQNMMDNYWLEDGSWYQDEGGYDGPQYSAEVFYRLAGDGWGAIYEARANRTVEHVMGMAGLEDLLEILQSGDPGRLFEVGASLPALIYGQRSYTGSMSYPWDTNLPFICIAVSELIRGGQEFRPLNAYSAPGAVAYYDLLIAETYADRGNSSKSAELARSAYGLLAAADALWVAEDEDTGAYQAEQYMHGVWDWGIILQALALAYRGSGDTAYLDRASDLVNYLDRHHWDACTATDRPCPGYSHGIPHTGKHLSGNHLVCKALLHLYDATGDSRYLDRARETIEFMLHPVLYCEDTLFPGHKISRHDWSASGGVASWACSGCNLALLGCIYEFNRLVEEGPGGVKLLPTCMVATASFGTSMRGKIDTLRQFRDGPLSRSSMGRRLVAWYYRACPPAADWLGSHPVAAKLVRIMLLPVVGLAQVSNSIL